MKVTPFPDIELPAEGHWSELTKTLWSSMLTQWKWYCDHSRSLGGEPRFPKVAEPADKDQLEALRFMAGRKLPKELETLLTKYSRRVEFFWETSDCFDPSSAAEDPYYGGGTLWDYSFLEKCCKAMATHESSPWIAFREGLRERLPFHQIGNGDILALCMRNGRTNCPVVYLSHENASDIHNRQISPNLIDFLVNWSALGCVSPELYDFDIYVNKRHKRVDGYGTAAKKFRKSLLRP